MTENLRRRTIAIAAIGAWLVGMNATSWSQPKTAEKVLMAGFDFDESGARSAGQVRVGFGDGSQFKTEFDDVVLILTDSKGEEIRQYGTWDPRVAVSREGLVKAKGVVRYWAKFTFDPRAAGIRAEVAKGKGDEVDLRAAIRAFCEKQKDDKECQLWSRLHP